MGWKAYIKLNQWTEKFFYQILPDFVKKLDDQTPFISASPCGTGYMQGIHSDDAGDTHLWQVWHGLQPLNFYRRHLTPALLQRIRPGIHAEQSLQSIFLQSLRIKALTSDVF